MTMISVEDAQTRILSRIVPVSRHEHIPLEHATGRILASDLHARLTQPPFDMSAMDGYAVRCDDVAIGATLHIKGLSAAGHAFQNHVGQNEAVRIFTGAPVPDGANGILIQENAEKVDDQTIKALSLVRHGQHIRPKGQDFHENERVLKAGIVLDFSALTVAAAMNHAQIEVRHRPKVALIATGDELVKPGSVPGFGQVIASNSIGIGALLRQAGADVLDLGIAADNKEAIIDAVNRAVQGKADIIVTLGGASVGDYDLVQSSLLSMGMVLDFWRIAMRPGKPLMVGYLKDIPVLGLPGNPVSSLVCGLLFLEPAVRKLAGLSKIDRFTTAQTTIALKANDQRQDYLRASLDRTAEGLKVTPFEKQDSSMMKLFSQADCLIVRPPLAPALSKGERCTVLMLRP